MLSSMNSSLKLLLKAVKGLVAMSAELDAVGTAMFNNQMPKAWAAKAYPSLQPLASWLVPKAWAAKAYPSLQPLASWLIDLEKRLKFIQTWMDEGHQASYWVSGFFFPQAFLTGARQNFARKHQYAIDKVAPKP
ncbi:dynein heavy chain and region D6 of dynein motor-domain-containing protein [Baffinella frigidus]|nr:dynein heavy chain and region D6 of dynein motor-domain-containing protein [Cryptophyta sp. CCMP2293]